MLPPSSSADKDEEEQVQVCGFSYWSELPLELKVDILCRLADKPLIRLKCVSKAWYFLISHHCVPKIACRVLCGTISVIEVRKSLEIREYISNLLIFSSDSDYYYKHNPQNRLLWGFHNVLRALPFKHVADELQDCCNGLMLLAHFVSLPVPTQYYVCNPITYECIAIPINPTHVNEESPCVASLLFDPNSFHISYMIAVRKEHSHHSLKLDVFSSSSSKWSSHILPLDHALDGYKFINRAIYLNGVLYMLSLAKYMVCISLIPNSDILFSHAIALPGKDEFNSCGTFGVSGRNLAYSNSSKSEILVWMLQKGARWVLRHKIRIDEFLAHIDPDVYSWFLTMPECGPMRVYAFDPNSENIIIGNPILLNKYNPKSKETDTYDELASRRSRTGDQYRVFPLSRCPVILNSIIQT